MKKLILLALPALVASCTSNEYRITGKVNEQLDSTTVYLLNEKEETLDSCLITNGSFKFEGTATDQTVYTLKYKNKQNRIFVQSGSNILFDATEMPPSATDEGGLNDQFQAVQTEIQKQLADLRAMSTKMRKDSVANEVIADSVKAARDQINNYLRATIDANKDNIMGAYIFGLTANQLYSKLEQIDSVCNVLKYAQSITMIQKIRENLQVIENTKEGKPYTDFRGISIDGKVKRLSDYVGKGNYVLVDFWASWCMPCKKEIPYLIKLHNKYKDQGLTVLGVNIADKTADYKRALETLNINYPQLEIPSYAKENGAKMYNVKSIPHIMLIAPDGTILKRGLHGEEMVKYIEELLGK